MRRWEGLGLLVFCVGCGEGVAPEPPAPALLAAPEAPASPPALGGGLPLLHVLSIAVPPEAEASCGSLSETVLRSRLALDDCIVDPDLAGAVDLRIHVGLRGVVQNVEVVPVSGSLPDSFSTCVTNAASRWHFAPELLPVAVTVGLDVRAPGPSAPAPPGPSSLGPTGPIPAGGLVTCPAIRAPVPLGLGSAGHVGS